MAGCDRLTISPALLKELEESHLPVTGKLTAENAKKLDIPELTINEKSFRHDINADPMACDKLSDGIRKFEDDAKKLKEIIRGKLTA